MDERLWSRIFPEWRIGVVEFSSLPLPIKRLLVRACKNNGEYVLLIYG